MASQFLTDARVILERIAVGSPGDPTMRADITTLQEAIITNNAADADNAASDAEVKTLLLEILNRLAEAPAPEPVP